MAPRPLTRLTPVPDPDRRAGADWPAWPVLALLVAGWLMMVWPWAFGYVTIPWDAKAHFQPQIQFLAQTIWRGDSPFWAPNVFSGHPQIADPQSMIFSPPMLLLALVNPSPSAWAIDMTVLGTGLVGAMFLALWMRDQGWLPVAALIGGLVFTFGASMSWRMQHTGQVLSLAYWPIALFALDCALLRGSWRAGLGAGLVGAAIVLGRDQVALIGIYLLVARAVYLIAIAERPVSAVRRALGPLALGGVAGLAVIALPVTLTALLSAESNRPEIDYIGAGRGSLHPALLMTALLPQLFGAAGRMEDYWGPPSFAWNDTGLYIAQNMGQVYVGLIPLALIVLLAVRGRLLDREIRFFSIALLVVLLYALGWYTPVFRVCYEILPGVKFYRRPADATFWVGALAAISAGYGAHRLFAESWQDLTRRDGVILAALVAAAVLFAVVLALRLDRLDRLGAPLLLALVSLVAATLAVALAMPRRALQPMSAAVILAGVTAADLGVNNGPSSSSALPPSWYAVLEPDTRNETIAKLKSLVARNATRRDRIELAGLGFHWPNASLTHDLDNTLGYNPVRLRLYTEATGAGDTVGLPDQRKFAPLMPSYRSLLADLLGLRYIATGVPISQIDRSVAADDFELIARTPDAYLYANPRALPRVLFASAARRMDQDYLVTTGRWPDFDPTREVVLDVRAVDAGLVSRAPGRARLVSYRNTEVVIEADSPAGGWVVLHDPWHPWWRAEVDGRPVKIERANAIFRAIAVPGGRVTVRFRFRPLLGAWEQLTARRR
jgi:hypothetical protein